MKRDNDDIRIDELTERLPRDIEPARDLWPGIRARIRIEEQKGAPPRSAPGWKRWGALAASLLLVSVALVATLRSPTPDAPLAVEGAAGAALPASLVADDPFLAAQREYVEAVEALLAAIEVRRSVLPPAEVEALRRDLDLIDRALDELRASLDEASPERRSEEMLAEMYRKKIDLLWRVARLSS